MVRALFSLKVDNDVLRYSQNGTYMRIKRPHFQKYNFSPITLQGGWHIAPKVHFRELNYKSRSTLKRRLMSR